MNTAALEVIPALPALSDQSAQTVIPARPAQSCLGSYGAYRYRFASCDEDREAAFRLRFQVFNLELQEGFGAAYETGMDVDPFDRVCEHLIVEEQVTGKVVGTYRMQAGDCAHRNRGFYSDSLFDLMPFAAVNSEILELGRACIDRDHRSMQVLTLLWRGIGQYAQSLGLRYLLGCSSLSSQEAIFGRSMYRRLQPFLAGQGFRTSPRARHILEEGQLLDPLPEPPKLLKAYLAVGAQICGRPAIDHDFGTIDFLTILDLQRLSPAARTRFLR